MANYWNYKSLEDSMEEKGVATLERALTILAAFTEADLSLPLAEISRRTGLYKSTLLRLLVTLERFGYIGQQADGNYHVGPAALYLGGIYQRWVRPPEVINPILVRLVEETEESASFNVREGTVRVCVYRVDSPQKIRDHVRVGDVLPLPDGAAGKVLSAFDVSPDDVQWDAVREACFASSRGEISRDTAAVSAPVFEAGGRCIGALAITGPASRFTDEKVAHMRIQLIRSALDLTFKFAGPTTQLESALHLAERDRPDSSRH
jgi:DNA-binding IclR family transcriptional regulator